MIGHKRGSPIPTWRRVLTKRPGQCLPRALVFIGGLFRINIERPKVDYTKYLGPDWTPSYENMSTYVFNHVCWMVKYSLSTYIQFLIGYTSRHVVGSP